MIPIKFGIVVPPINNKNQIITIVTLKELKNAIGRAKNGVMIDSPSNSFSALMLVYPP